MASHSKPEYLEHLETFCTLYIIFAVYMHVQYVCTYITPHIYTAYFPCSPQSYTCATGSRCCVMISLVVASRTLRVTSVTSREVTTDDSGEEADTEHWGVI